MPQYSVIVRDFPKEAMDITVPLLDGTVSRDIRRYRYRRVVYLFWATMEEIEALRDEYFPATHLSGVAEDFYQVGDIEIMPRHKALQIYDARISGERYSLT